MFQRPPDPRHRSHHRDPRRGPGPDGMPFGFREMLARAGRGGRGPIRRGEIRPLILAVLAAKPMHGYEVIQELEARSGGRWRPSAGSVYPTLQQLSDEGLVTSEEIDGRRTYTLTAEGRAASAANPAPSPWADAGPGDGDLKVLGMQLVGAVLQVERMGSARARRETIRLLTETRRAVYRILADDEEADPDGTAPDGTGSPGHP